MTCVASLLYCEAQFSSLVDLEGSILSKLRNYIQKHKDSEAGFWPSTSFISDFRATYDFRLNKPSKTLYSKEELFKELYPSLIQSWALRKIFRIKEGVGKIKNMDETMSYSFQPTSKTYTHF